MNKRLLTLLQGTSGSDIPWEDCTSNQNAMMCSCIYVGVAPFVKKSRHMKMGPDALRKIIPITEGLFALPKDSLQSSF